MASFLKKFLTLIEDFLEFSSHLVLLSKIGSLFPLPSITQYHKGEVMSLEKKIFHG